MPAFRRRATSLFVPAFAVIALSTLAGCDESNPSQFAPVCPATDVPGTIADRYVYDGKGLDAGSLISHAQLTAVAGDCERGPKGPEGQIMVRTRVSLAMTVTRGAAATDSHIDIPYFIAILRDGKIVDKKTFSDTFTLPPYTGAQSIRTDLRLIDLPASENLQTNPYTLEIGYQLTRSELDYNRQHLLPAQFHSRSQ